MLAARLACESQHISIYFPDGLKTAPPSIAKLAVDVATFVKQRFAKRVLSNRVTLWATASWNRCMQNHEPEPCARDEAICAIGTDTKMYRIAVVEARLYALCIEVLV